MRSTAPSGSARRAQPSTRRISSSTPRSRARPTCPACRSRSARCCRCRSHPMAGVASGCPWSTACARSTCRSRRRGNVIASASTRSSRRASSTRSGSVRRCPCSTTAVGRAPSFTCKSGRRSGGMGRMAWTPWNWSSPRTSRQHSQSPQRESRCLHEAMCHLTHRVASETLCNAAQKYDTLRPLLCSSCARVRRARKQSRRFVCPPDRDCAAYP
mmetsp:Transcript_5276/g.15576  ORF Transcript_5276/g.15576 Transcript_5276/m.15576 type:complete len:214 (-) Transcript_5276:62-703(-)